MSKKQFVLTALLRIGTLVLLLGSAYLIGRYTLAPAWIAWLEGVCALMQAGFLAGDWRRYRDAKENTTDSPS